LAWRGTRAKAPARAPAPAGHPRDARAARRRPLRDHPSTARPRQHLPPRAADPQHGRSDRERHGYAQRQGSLTAALSSRSTGRLRTFIAACGWGARRTCLALSADQLDQPAHLAEVSCLESRPGVLLHTTARLPLWFDIGFGRADARVAPVVDCW